MPEKTFIQRLSLYLKSGRDLVIDFKTEDQKTLNPQIEILNKALGDPASQEKVVVFQGERLVQVRIREIAALEVLSLVLTPAKGKNPADK